jgi:hypothetical protein
MTTSHPQLSPELQRLTDDALLLWSDAAARQQVLLDLLAAWHRGDSPGVASAVGRIDRAVIAGLAALGLPRAPGVRVEAGAFGRRWVGRVTPDNTLQIDLERIAQHLAQRGHPDRAFHTWIHESLHARRLPSLNRHREYARWPGYEEGMVEGLTRHVTGSSAGIPVEHRSFDYYVEAYRVLAATGGFPMEQLWRALWLQAPGDVRTYFVTSADAARQDRGLPQMTRVQSAQLRRVGDTVWAEAHYYDRPDPDLLARFWESAFR